MDNFTKNKCLKSMCIILCTLHLLYQFKLKTHKMTKITNFSEQNLKNIAAAIGGRLWIKGDKVRIYCSGGNNYHYDGQWYVEINQDGSRETRCYLTSGYNNLNRAEYVAKYMGIMESNMNDVLGEGSTEEVAAPAAELEFNEEIEASLLCPPVSIVANEHYNPKLTPVRRVANLNDTPMRDFYHGTQQYRVYVKDDAVIAMTSNLSRPSNEPAGAKSYILTGSCGEICFNF